MDAKEFQIIKDMANNSPIQYIKMSGLRCEIAEERHCRMVMPFNETHINHVGIAYAGSEFVLAETYTAIILECTYGHGKYIPIAAKDEIEFVKPCTTDMIIDYSLTQEEADAMIAPIKERGKGRVVLKYPIQNTKGEVVANMTATVYLIPAEAASSFMK